MQTYQYGLQRRSRTDNDQIMKVVLTAIASVAILIVFLIIVFTLSSTGSALSEVGILEILFGTTWSPSSGAYGAAAIIIGTLLVTLGAIIVALPLGLGAAIYLSEIASPKVRNILKPVCEIFAGIPSVVYGFFGLLVLLPLLQDIFPDQLVYSQSWLAASILLGIMALPTVISVAEDAIHSVPQSYREASLAMGATRWETTIKVVVPAAISGITAAIILGIGRAIGETMAVMMVAGNAAVLPDPIWNIFSLISTITGILALEIPEASTGDLHYSALFLLAVILMVLVLVINLASRVIIKRMRRKLGVEPPRVPLFFKRTKPRETSSMENWITEHKALIVQAFVYVCIFVFVWMMASLFVTDVLALGYAIVVTVVVFALRNVFDRFNTTVKQQFAHGTMTAIMVIVVAILIVILGYILINGLSVIDWEFLTTSPENSGRDGGIAPAIVGTIELIIGTALISLPLGIFTGVYLSEYAKDTKFTRLIREAIDLLNGTPSIVFGLFGLAFFVRTLDFGVSMVAGWFVLAFMIMPVIIRTTEEALTAVPHDLREASMAMGASKWRTTVRVVLPAAMGGVMTGTILALGRAAGETAPIMFVAAVSSATNPYASSIFDSVMALPYHLYYLATHVVGSTDMQYGTATVLLVIVLGMFLVASIIRIHYNKKVKW